MVVKLQSVRFDNPAEPRLGRNSLHPGCRARDGRSSPPASTAPGFSRGPASWPSGGSAARLLMAHQLGVSGGGRGPQAVIH